MIVTGTPVIPGLPSRPGDPASPCLICDEIWWMMDVWLHEHAPVERPTFIPIKYIFFLATVAKYELLNAIKENGGQLVQLSFELFCV